MPEADDNILRRKIALRKADRGYGGPGADRGWRLALALAARDRLALAVDVAELALSQVSLGELLERPPERALIALLQGPGDGMGLIALAPEVLAAMIEVQTLGRVAATPVPPRRPTRTDAAMVAEVLDAALAGLEVVLAEEADLIWAGGFRYGSFLDDPRPLGLLLEDIPYRLLRAEVVLGDGARRGQVLLALPAEGRGSGPRRDAEEEAVAAQAGPAFATALAEQVGAADCVLDAVLARLSLPIARVLELSVGDVLALPRASIDRLGLVGLDGHTVSEGRLGQSRGMRAVRLVAGETAARPGAGAGVPVGVAADAAVAETLPQRQIA